MHYITVDTHRKHGNNDAQQRCYDRHNPTVRKQELVQLSRRSLSCCQLCEFVSKISLLSSTVSIYDVSSIHR